MNVAFGLRFTFFDRGDPRTDSVLLTCLERWAANLLASSPPVPPGGDVDGENRKREEAIRVAVKPCRDAAAARRWSRSAWIGGVAPTWTSPDGKTSDVGYSGTALWTSLGFGFEGVPVLEDHAMIAAYFNENPKPFIWTTRASDILEKVKRARHYSRCANLVCLNRGVHPIGMCQKRDFASFRARQFSSADC